MDNEIKISIDEYNALQYNDSVLDFMIEALKDAARLNYSGERLSFDDDIIDKALKLLLPDTYRNTLYALQAKKAADEEFKKENEE